MEEYDTVSTRWKCEHDLQLEYFLSNKFLKSSRITKNVCFGEKHFHPAI